MGQIKKAIDISSVSDKSPMYSLDTGRSPKSRQGAGHPLAGDSQSLPTGLRRSSAKVVDRDERTVAIQAREDRGVRMELTESTPQGLKPVFPKGDLRHD
jgi:hypothetical protein